MPREIPVQLLRSTSVKLNDFGSYPLFAGEVAIALDTKHVYIGTGTENRNLSLLSSQTFDPAIKNILQSITAQEAVDELSEMVVRNIRDILITSMELVAVKNQSLYPDLSFFVDSFNDADDIDAESTNYELNAAEGFVSLNQGGAYTAKDTTKAQFDQGVYSDTESIIDVGGDGLLQKELLLQGNKVVVEDFDNISNVSTSGSGTQTQNTSNPFEGDNALDINVDFSGTSTTELCTTAIDLTSINISLYKYLRLYYLKPNSGAIEYDIQVEDTVGVVFTYPTATLTSGYSYKKIQKLIADITGINKAAVRYIRIRFKEVSANQVILEVTGTLNNTHQEVNKSNSLKQTFVVTEQTVAKRIMIRVRSENAALPTAPLTIGLANALDTTYGIATIQPSQVTTAWSIFYLDFDNNCPLLVGNEYSILMRSTTELTNGWDIFIVGNVYADGKLYNNTVAQNSNDLYFTLFKPPVSETVTIDNLEIEAESTYEVVGNFTSRAINLGLTPNSLTSLYWTMLNQGDSVRVRIRFATTEAGLTAASWSGFFTDASGAGNNLTGITPQQWFQYYLEFTGGNEYASSVVYDVNLDYAVTAGSGNATIISRSHVLSDIPDMFIVLWQLVQGSGTGTFFISRDGKASWITLTPNDNGKYLAFTGAVGSTVHLKAILTGNAKLYGWSVSCDREAT